MTVDSCVHDNAELIQHCLISEEYLTVLNKYLGDGDIKSDNNKIGNLSSNIDNSIHIACSASCYNPHQGNHYFGNLWGTFSQYRQQSHGRLQIIVETLLM